MYCESVKRTGVADARRALLKIATHNTIYLYSVFMEIFPPISCQAAYRWLYVYGCIVADSIGMSIRNGYDFIRIYVNIFIRIKYRRDPCG